jgi:multidrug efflux pump subunit AcrA (membrane-fusion protein)
MRGKWLLAAGTVILVGIGAGALSLLRRTSSQAVPVSKAAPVSARTSVGNEISLPGTIRAQNVVLVAAPLEGMIETILVQVGEDVYENQPLARIQNTSLQASRDLAMAEVERAQSRVNSAESMQIAARLEASRARADAARARSGFDVAEKAALRQETLYREGATPRLVYEKAQKEYETAKAEYETLRELANHAEDRAAAMAKELDAARQILEQTNQDLEQTAADLAAAEVRSPVNGVLIAARAGVGDQVNQNMTDLFQIAVDLLHLEVVVEPPPPALARIRTGQLAQVLLAETPNEAIPATVKEVKGGQVIVEFTSPNPIRPNLSAQVRIKLT